MTKRKFQSAANPLQNAVSSQPHIAEDNSLAQVDMATYGKVDLPDSGRQIATPLSLDDIYPDLRQPRRAIPASVRGEWAGNPADIPGLLQQWHRMASSLTPKSIDLLLLLQGLGEPLNIEADDAVLHDYLELVRLAASIHKDGLKNPISVVRRANNYLIETGERRYIAHWLLRKFVDEKYARVPARIVERHDVWAQAAENGVRKPLNAIGMARQLALLIMAMYEGDPDVSFDPYEKMILPGEIDRRFYAQVSGGNRYRIKRNMGERVMQVTGLKSTDQIGQYRALLDISDELWMEADIHNWAEGKIRAILKPPTEDKPTVVGLSGDEPAGLKPIGDADWMIGKRVSWQQDGATMTGTVGAVYRATSLPRPGALMAQIKDETGQQHQKETMNLMLAPMATSAQRPAVPEAAPVLPPDTEEMLSEYESLGLDDAWHNGVRFVLGDTLKHISGRDVVINDFIHWQDDVYALVSVWDDAGEWYDSRCKLTELVKPAPGKSFQPADDDEDGLPERQEEMLLAIFHQHEIVKNGATRQALEEKGMIAVLNRIDWQMIVTKKGADYLRKAGLVPDAPPAPPPALPEAAAGGPAVWLSPDEERMLVGAYRGDPMNVKDNTAQTTFRALKAKGMVIMSSSAMGKIDPTSAGRSYLKQHGLIDAPDEDNAHSARQPQSQPAADKSTAIQGFVWDGKVWQIGNRVQSKHTRREGIIRGFKRSQQTGNQQVLWDIESSANPSGKVPMQSDIADLILLDAQPAPDATTGSAETQWSNDRIVSQTSENARMLVWINTVGQSLTRPNLAGGAINRLLESTPAQIAQFIQVNGMERYLQMLQSDNETVNAFLQEITQKVNDLCQTLWEQAQEIEQQGKA